jgi:hypothetical protein
VDLHKAARPLGIGTDIPVRDRVEVSVPAVPASEDNARDFAGGQRVKRSVDGCNLLVPGRSVPAATLRSPSLFSSSVAHSEHVPQSRLQYDFRRRPATPVQPVFKILNFYDVRNLGMPDSYLDTCQSLAGVADPFLPAQRGEGPSDGLIERLGGDVKRVRGLVEIVDDDGASLQGHECNYQSSLFVLLLAFDKSLGFGEFPASDRIAFALSLLETGLRMCPPEKSHDSEGLRC